MADDAFVFSPISTRPVLPSEADYDAIRETLIKTSRGRWFLREYAKRNGNTDTAMVFDAVARIEQALAAQRQDWARKASLAETLAAVGAAIEATLSALGACSWKKIWRRSTKLRASSRKSPGAGKRSLSRPASAT